jgi:arginyl-tRNA synthetase
MEQIKETLKQSIKNLYSLDFEPEITPAPENIDADYSSNAPLKLAKELHKPPMQIAEELLAELKTDGPERSGAQKISISQPGFLNFSLPDSYLTSAIDKLSMDFAGEIVSNEFAGKTVICEFSDPNPFKVLHVGHLYTSVVGDSISRLYEYAGAKVIRANFGGDVGLHVAKTMYALLQKNISDLQIEDIAKCYIEGTAAYDEDESAKAEITKLNKEIYRINSENIHDTPLSRLYWKGRELSYEYFNNFYSHIGVHFDRYYPESTVAALGLETVKKQLANGIYEKSDGAVIFPGEKFGLHTRVFINKEGVPTYEAKDVGLIFTKWQDYHFDKSVIITGGEQLEYMKVVLKSIEQYAPDLVARTSHLTHGLVKLPGGVKMSSRKGNFLKAVDVLELVDDALKTEYDSTDEKVSLAATKYAFLKYKMGGNIIFDPKESVKMTGNSGPYLLYSAVRAKKILSKVNKEARDEVLSRPLATDEEQRSEVSPVTTGRDERVAKESSRELAKKLLEYKGVLGEAVSEMAPHKLANYLYELAQDFSRFYENCPVAGSEQESERIKLVKVYLDVMTHGLNILGIEIPEEM